MWKRHTDEASGRVFTYPKGSTDPGDLWLVCGGADGREYFHNVNKNLTTWALPELTKPASSEAGSEAPEIRSGIVPATPSPPSAVASRAASAAQGSSDSDSDSEEEREKSKNLKERLAAVRKQREQAEALRKQRRAAGSTPPTAAPSEAQAEKGAAAPEAVPPPQSPDTTGPPLTVSQLAAHEAQSPQQGSLGTPAQQSQHTPRTPQAVATLTEALAERLGELKGAQCADCKQARSAARFCPETGRAHGRPEPEVASPVETRHVLNTATEARLRALLAGKAESRSSGSACATPPPAGGSPLEELAASSGAPQLQGTKESAVSPQRRGVSEPRERSHEVGQRPPTHGDAGGAASRQRPPAASRVSTSSASALSRSSSAADADDAAHPAPSAAPKAPPVGSGVAPSPSPSPRGGFSHKTITLYDPRRGETELRVVRGVAEGDMLRVIRAKLGVPADKPIKIMTRTGFVSFDAVDDGAVYMYTVEEVLDIDLVRRVLLDCHGGVTAAYSNMAVCGLVEPSLVRQQFDRLSLGDYAEPFIATLGEDRSLVGFAKVLGIPMPEPTPRRASLPPTDPALPKLRDSSPPSTHRSTPVRGPAEAPTPGTSAQRPLRASPLRFDDEDDLTPLETPEHMRRSVAEAIERREKLRARPKGTTGLGQRVVYPNGSVYEGSLVEGLRHGEGRLTHGAQTKPVSIYDGEWIEGRQDGAGSMAWAGKGCYQGEWRGGQMEGRGKLQAANLNLPRATFEAGRLNGKAAVQYPNGDTFRGELANNHRASGTVEHANGDVYKWKCDPKTPGTGIALLRYKAGDIYEGDLKKYKKHGRGVFTFAGGHVYEGEFADGRMSGSGTLKYAEGSTYTGEFRENLFSGKGMYTDATGQEYVGEWRQGKMHGQGIMTFANGDKWQGVWADDVRMEGDYLEFTPPVPSPQQQTPKRQVS